MMQSSTDIITDLLNFGVNFQKMSRVIFYLQKKVHIQQTVSFFIRTLQEGDHKPSPQSSEKTA